MLNVVILSVVAPHVVLEISICIQNFEHFEQQLKIRQVQQLKIAILLDDINFF